MSLHDYRSSMDIAAGDPPFCGLIMAAMRKADTANLMKLRDSWPGVYDELRARYNAPGGLLPGEEDYA